jgi:hypothetical protein
MDQFALICVRLLEAMFAIGMVFSSIAIVAGAIDFARSFAEA